MSHKVIGNDAGVECLPCGAAFDCSKCQALTEAFVAAGYPSAFDFGHDCETDRLLSLVECTGPDDPASDCKTDEHDGAHHWVLSFPWIAGEGRNFQADDLVAECHYCGIQRPAIQPPTVEPNLTAIQARAEALLSDPRSLREHPEYDAPTRALDQACGEWNDPALRASVYPDSSGV